MFGEIKSTDMTNNSHIQLTKNFNFGIYSVNPGKVITGLTNKTQNN